MNCDGRKVMSSLPPENGLLWIVLDTLILNLPPIQKNHKSGANDPVENVIPECTGIWATS